MGGILDFTGGTLLLVLLRVIVVIFLFAICARIAWKLGQKKNREG